MKNIKSKVKQPKADPSRVENIQDKTVPKLKKVEIIRLVAIRLAESWNVCKKKEIELKQQRGDLIESVAKQALSKATVKDITGSGYTEASQYNGEKDYISLQLRVIDSKLTNQIKKLDKAIDKAFEGCEMHQHIPYNKSLEKECMKRAKDIVNGQTESIDVRLMQLYKNPAIKKAIGSLVSDQKLLVA